MRTSDSSQVEKKTKKRKEKEKKRKRKRKGKKRQEKTRQEEEARKGIGKRRRTRYWVPSTLTLYLILVPMYQYCLYQYTVWLMADASDPRSDLHVQQLAAELGDARRDRHHTKTKFQKS